MVCIIYYFASHSQSVMPQASATATKCYFCCCYVVPVRTCTSRTSCLCPTLIEVLHPITFPSIDICLVLNRDRTDSTLLTILS